MNWIDTMSASGSYARFGGGTRYMLSHGPVRLIGDFLRRLMKLQDARMTRIQLREMDERMLKDIGLTRGQVDEYLSHH